MLHKRSKAMLRLVLWTVDFEDSIRAFWHGFFRGFHWNNISQPPGSRKKTTRHHHRTGRSKRWSLAPFQNRPGNCDFFEATRGFFRDQGGKEKAKVCVCVCVFQVIVFVVLNIGARCTALCMFLAKIPSFGSTCGSVKAWSMNPWHSNPRESSSLGPTSHSEKGYASTLEFCKWDGQATKNHH